MLVEDEPALLKLTQMILEKKGYTVLSADSPLEAMALAKGHEGAVHLLITDVVMPQMNGLELAGQLTALFPDMKILFMSGYTADIIARHGKLDKGMFFIQKPFTMGEMDKKVREALMG